MAERRSSRDLAAALINGLAQLDEENPHPDLRRHDRNRSELNAFIDQLDQRSPFNPPHTQCPHPASTDFSLDTLSHYLRREFNRQRRKEEYLQNSPQSASIDEEKNELRRSVNDSNPIALSIGGGRLAVSPYYLGSDDYVGTTVEGNSGRVPTRAHGFSRTSFSKGKTPLYRTSCSSRPTNKKTHVSSATAGELTPHSEDAVPVLAGEPSNLGSDVFEDTTSVFPDLTFLDSLPRHSWSTNPSHSSWHTADGESANEDETNRSVGSVTMQEATDDSDALHDFFLDARTTQNEITRAPIAMNRVSTTPPTGSPSRAIDIVHGTTPSRQVGSRSLSFERHANEFRQSARSSIENVRNTLFAIDSEDSEVEFGIPRLRKTVARGLDPSRGSIASTSASVPCRSTFAGPARKTHRSPTSPSVSSSSLEDNRRLGAVPHRSSIPEQKAMLSNTRHQSRDHTSNTRSTDQWLSTSSSLSTSRQAPVGHDTFYSGSSDDDDSIGEDEDIQFTKSELAQKLRPKMLERPRTEQCRKNADHAFDWERVVPERLPPDIRQARENCKRIWAATGLDEHGQLQSDGNNFGYNTQYTAEELDPYLQNILGAPDKFGQYPRHWSPQRPTKFWISPITKSPTAGWDELPPEIWPTVCQYLSSQEVRDLRLVNRATAEAILPLMTRSVVTKFGRSMFNAGAQQTWDSKLECTPQDSMFRVCGHNINRFGITFEYDHLGLACAEPKEIEKEISAWFGRYTWPTEKYPRFAALKEMEDLVDNNSPLLKNTMKTLTGVSELALCVDSGHGWLNGPDISDLALFRQRQSGGSRIFGRTFDASDAWDEFALHEYFRWGQTNSINAYTKHLERTEAPGTAMREQLNLLRRLQVREYDSYRVQRLQPDFNRYAHTGGLASTVQHQQQHHHHQPLPQPQLQQNQTIISQAIAGFQNWAMPPLTTTNNIATQNNAMVVGPGTWMVPNGPHMAPAAFIPPNMQFQHGRVRHHVQPTSPPPRDQDSSTDDPILPQWPLVFNCHNLAGQVGGNRPFIQEMISHPSQFGYMPGDLSEAQVQWLMETLWAQRAFLSAYTNSIVSNAGFFKNVHSLHIAKLSSGLIPSIAQREFWQSLPGLKKLTLKVSADWRQEHVPGDKFFSRNMAISPVEASSKLAYLLENFIAHMENLSVLHVGFVGGGEHQTGIFARNNHVLPAPITRDPRAWLTNHETEPDSTTMFSFNHIRELTFENCWFSPFMLERFMDKSRDTSLHHLTLDSVSLTGIHDTRADGPLTTTNNNLRCEYSPGEWLQESIPSNACWVRVLDSITPGKTIEQRKYEADMIDEEENPPPGPEFRGNVKAITLKSCGYVRINGIRAEQFSQNGLVEHSNPWLASDEGLEARKKLFYVSNRHDVGAATGSSDRRRSESTRRRQSTEISKEVVMQCIMMSPRDPESRSHWFGLGRLTQCIHPVEKRVLERAWGMRFGWGDTMERWGAVEDGCYEGGTGRFSGSIQRGTHD